MKDEPLGWDKDKKAKRDRERDIAIERGRVGTIYQSWQQRLCKRARTHREILQSIYDLQKLLDDKERELGEIAAEVFPFAITRRMWSEKIALLTAEQICMSNHAIQHVPITMQMRTDGTVVTPKKAEFRTMQEFLVIDFVKHFAEQPGFLGFYAKMSFEDKDIKYFIIAHYGTDSCIACELFNDICLDDFAQYDDIDPGEDCPNCPNQGWYVVAGNGVQGESPEQVQCQWCDITPNSKFNLREAAKARPPQALEPGNPPTDSSPSEARPATDGTATPDGTTAEGTQPGNGS